MRQDGAQRHLRKQRQEAYANFGAEANATYVALQNTRDLFPPSDPQWKGADSAVFLREALKRIRGAGYGLANVDASLILAAPKIGPHAQEIRLRVAELLKARGARWRSIISAPCR